MDRILHISIQSPTFECYGSPGPVVPPTFTDYTKANDYLDEIISQSAFNVLKFNVQAMQMDQIYRTTPTVMPSGISTKLATNWPNWSNMSDALADAYSSNNLSGTYTTSWTQNASYIQDIFADTDDRIIANDSLDDVNLYLANLSNAISSWETNTSSKWTEIYNQLLSETNTDPQNVKWKSVLKALVYWNGQDSLNTTYATNIRSIAQLCGDQYGDVVYHARALLMEEDYSVYDNCLSTSGITPREKANNITEELHMQVSPNPNIGSMQIQFNQLVSGKLSLQSVDGKIIYEEKLIEQSNFNLEIDIKSGTYYITFNNNKNSIVKPVIILNK